MNLLKSYLDWLSSEKHRRAQRHVAVPLIVFYWEGSESVAHTVLNISDTGLYLLTTQRWYPGTVITMTLQRAEAQADDPERSITAFGKVVRSGIDGVGVEFVWPGTTKVRRLNDSSIKEADTEMFKIFFKKLHADVRLRAG